MSERTPFRKLLIANRGEISLRIQRSARALGYRTVAVYSTADAQARHVREADQAVWIGESAPARSYLNIPALLEAARKTGADAVHPGYGFLAENAEFAQACRDAGLVFVGPSPASIHAMGNKARAKHLMLEARVPCVPGYQEDDQSEKRLAGEADRIGYPIMIKAAAGGGGRGMRLAASTSEFLDLLRTARSEAEGAFGDPTVILERAIVGPRHIEIQVFGDRHGGAIHLGERDCSIQRRHQKLIEEAPSPAVSAALRERMGAAAVAAVKAFQYEGAGTLEFLLDRAGEFYFMEMNTRLQVEHPVTEAITGLDLVEWQLRVAAGEPLPLGQDEVRFRGHAIEARLCAEDADRSFMPQSGTLAFWRAAEGPRTEHALESGAEIPPFYDSMIAKVVAHGATREEARRKLLRGLEDTVALGLKTNRSFLIRCLDHPIFARGGATTAFIAENLGTLTRRDEDGERLACVLAAVLLVETAAGAASGDARHRLSHRLPIGLRYEVDGEKRSAILTEVGARRYQVTLAGERDEFAVVDLDGHSVRFLCDGVMESAIYARDGARLMLHFRGETHDVVDATLAGAARRDSGGERDGRLRASMNGRVVSVFVAAGDRVAAGQPVLTLEAMKMEHIHAAPISGLVKALHVAVGDQAPANRVVAEIEPDVVATQ